MEKHAALLHIGISYLLVGLCLLAVTGIVLQGLLVPHPSASVITDSEHTALATLPAEAQSATADTAPPSASTSQAASSSSLLPAEAGELILVGVVISSAKNNSSAVIEYRGKQQMYSVGEAVVNSDLLLSEVNEKSATLRYFEHPVRLPLQKGLIASTPSKANLQQLTAGESRQMDTDNHAQLIRLTPVQSQGMLSGLAASPNGDSRRFLELGLESDDVITEINGVDMTTIEGIEQAPSLMQGSQPLQLSVRRQGRLMTLFIEP